MKLLVTVFIVLLLAVQYQIWVGDDGIAEVWRLERAIAAQEAENASLRVRNRRLQAKVEDLKEGLAVVEERARRDLGMIREDEVFFQMVEE